MPDILPDEIRQWQAAEESARRIFALYGYKEMRTPIMEEEALFKRGIGLGTDIVQKQMYTFKDRGERPVALRPEGTASVVRAYLENDLANKLPLCRLYYIGPMFRSERPQAGRLRQFYQIGLEAIGSDSPYVDAEAVYIMLKILEAARLDGVDLKINSLGCKKDKKAFGEVLKKDLGIKIKSLCEDCGRRHETNVLRVFDCKNDSCKAVLKSAPKIIDHICPECRAHFDKVKEALGSVAVKYAVDPFLVRGLDYYTGTVFEATHKDLGSQDAVAAGGRYDDLIEEMGGKPTPACGFAIGLDRLLLAAKDKMGLEAQRPGIFLILLGDGAQKIGFKLLADLTNQGVSAQADFGGKSLKSQMRLADRIGAKKVLIIGDEELKKRSAVLRDMEKKEQKEISIDDVTDTHLR